MLSRCLPFWIPLQPGYRSIQDIAQVCMLVCFERLSDPDVLYLISINFGCHSVPGVLDDKLKFAYMFR